MVSQHDITFVQADTLENAKSLLLNRAKSKWPEDEGWSSHRVAVDNLDSLIDKLRARDPDFSSHSVFVGSQFAINILGIVANANGVSIMSAVSEEHAVKRFKIKTMNRFPSKDGWVSHSFVYKSLGKIIME